MVKLVIFDFDGVIITGSNKGYFACYHKALEEVGVKLPKEEERKRILEWWGKGYKMQLRLLLKEHLSLLPKAIKVYEKYYYSPVFSEKIRLIEGADRALGRLEQKYTLAIASGMMRKTMNQLIKNFGINFFKKIVTNEDVKKEEDMKPAPFILNKILQDLSIPKEESVFVGDAVSDVKMSQNAGIAPVVVLTGHLTKAEAKALGVKDLIPNITHLEEALNK